MKAGGGQDRFVSGTTDLKEDQTLILELNLFVVETPRQQHRAIGALEILAGKSGPGLLAR